MSVPLRLSVSHLWSRPDCGPNASTPLKDCRDPDDKNHAANGKHQGGCHGNGHESRGPLGNGLYEQLVPPALTASLEQFADGATIAIESNAHWIPWEILGTRASGPLLSERFQLIRIPRKPALALDAADDPVSLESMSALESGISRVVSVTGDDILSASDSSAEFNRRTFGLAAGLVQDLVEGSVIDLQQAVVGADIVHFTCHGRAPPYHLSIGPRGGAAFFRQAGAYAGFEGWSGGVCERLRLGTIERDAG